MRGSGAGEVVRTLLIGYGAMGRYTHFPLLFDSQIANVIGIVRASGASGEAGVPVFGSLEQALEEQKPDLAVICTPHKYHYEQTKLCLKFGCHVLVEKPLALYYSQAEDLVHLAEEKKRFLVVGLQRRYEGLASVFKRIVGEGKLGRIEFIHGLFAHRFSRTAGLGWRADPGLAGEGILDDSAFHLIDLLLYFAGGQVRDLQALVLSGGREAMPHSFTVSFRTDGGAMVVASGSYLSPVNTVQEEISVWGTEGALFARRFRMNWNADPPSVFYKSADGEEEEEFDVSKMLWGKSLPLRALLSVLGGQASREALLTEAKDTLEAHRTIEMIRERGTEPGFRV